MMSGDTLIYGGRIITETHFIPSGYVLIKDGRIISVGEDWNEIKAGEKIDAGNNYVSPGFIDMHTHGIADVDFMESSEDKLIRGLVEYAGYGVTRVVGTTLSNTLDNIIQQMASFRKAKEDPVYGDLLHGAHVEGPWLAPRCRGGHALEYLCIPEKDDVRRLIGEAGDIIKTLTFAPELANGVWLAEQLSLNGIVGVIGHSEATFEEAEKVIMAGARHVTHMYDAILGYGENPDEALVMMPGVETAVLMNDEVSIELIGCPIHVPEPFFRFIDKVKPRGRKVIVTDSLVGTGMAEGTVLTYKDGRKVYVSGGVLRMIDEDPGVNGNLTGSAVTMNLALRRLKGYIGRPVGEVVRWASINPATTLGINGETGSIKTGKWADIVIMDEEFNIKKTLLKGKIVHGTS